MVDDKVYGLTLAKPEKTTEGIIVPSEKEAGAVTIDVGASNAAGHFSYSYDSDIKYETEKELIDQYREAALLPALDNAIQDVINEALVFTDMPVIKLELDEVEGVSAGIKNKIIDEFDESLSLLKFTADGDSLFKQWYIDGRLYGYMHMNNKSAATKSQGISEVRIIDPRYIRKVIQIFTDKDDLETGRETFYLFYNPTKQAKFGVTTKAIRLSEDSVFFIHSGIKDAEGVILSQIHKALKPSNQLNGIEEAVIIYRIARAPERRAFYIDIGDLPKNTAEQYMQNIMRKYKNKMTYDVRTGKMVDSRHIKSMLEDVWLPRRDGSRGTEVSTLQGGQNLGDIEDVDYFKKKLYESLNVPISRLIPEASMNIGRSGEIERDEIKFSKFVERLRHRFNEIFLTIMKVNLVAKKVLGLEDWPDIAEKIKFVYTSDMVFTELKKLEIIENRLNIMRDMSDLVGVYYSKEWVSKEILNMTDEEIELEKERMKAEAAEEAEMEDEFGSDEDEQEPDDEPDEKPEEPEDKKPPVDKSDDKEKEDKSDDDGDKE